ncbi:condensation domain-containing protein, partial [Streptomyces albipurpureus]
MIPLSFAQRRLWFLDRFEGPSATYNSAFAVWLGGELSVGALELALGDVVGRHEVLRTVVVEGDDGVPYQRVLSLGEVGFRLPVVEVGGVEERGAVLAEVSAACFDLAVDVPVRARLVRCGPGEHVLVLVVHHIAVDGESM